MHRVVVVALILLATLAHGATSVPLPPPTEWVASGMPAAPGDTFAVAFTGAAPAAAAPAIGEWPRGRIGPDESFTLTGARFTALTGDAAGSDTTVWLLGDTATGAQLRRCRLWSLHGDRSLIATVPADLPVGMYLVWVENRAGASAPICLNRSDPQWLGPKGDTVSAGARTRIFGRNLCADPGAGGSSVWLRRAGATTWESLGVTASDPYEVEFDVPTDLAAGTHAVRLHNRRGGAWGWGDPLTLRVAAPWQRGATVITVPAPSGGDDSNAVQTALDQAGAQAQGATVRLAAGTYRIARQLDLPARVRLLGAGRDVTTLVCESSARPYTWLMLRGPRIALEGLTVIERSAATYWMLRNPYPERWEETSLIDCRFATAAFEHATQPAVELNGSRMEVRGCVFDVELWLSGSDNWVHGNTFHGAPHDWSEGGLRPSGSRLLIEGNHAQTPDWPNVGGNRQYRDLLAANTLRHRLWCKRFLYTGAGNRHWHVARNTTTDVAIDENKGESILLHGVPHGFYAQVASSTATTTTIRSDGALFGSTAVRVDQRAPARSLDDLRQRWADVVENPDGWLHAVIVQGTGLGQSRLITAHTAQSITVDEPWRVPPAADSVIVIQELNRDIVIRGNVFDHFPAGYQNFYSATHFVSLDGNTVRTEIDGNTSRRAWRAAFIGGTGTSPSYWNAIRDLRAEGMLQKGIELSCWSWSGVDADLIGAFHCGNAVRSSRIGLDSAHIQDSYGGSIGVVAGGGLTAIGGGALTRRGAAIPFVGTIVEGNQCTGTQQGLSVGGQAQVLARGNALTLVDAPRESGAPRGIAIADALASLARNTVQQTAGVHYAGFRQGQVRPLLQVRVAAAAGSAPAATTIPVANLGAAATTWSVGAIDVPWASARVLAGATLDAEADAGVLEVTTAPAGLAAGVHWGTVVLNATSGTSARVGLRLEVTPGASNRAPTVSAGPDRAITLPATANLAGSANDDGLPAGSLSIAWSKVSGPGTVTFASASSTATTASFSVAGSYVLRLTASDGALSSSDDVAVTVMAAPPPGGTGTGLLGTYFDNADFTAPTLQRVDAQIAFDWGTGSPHASIGVDTFSVRWTGEVEVPVAGDWTFTTRTDDGVRLWIDDVLVIDRWVSQSPTEASATRTLSTGRHAIRMDYFENSGGAVAQLSWAHATVTKQAIPSDRLHPAAIGGMPDGWSAADIGAVAAAGSTTQADGVWTLRGSGADIWNRMDEFQYAHRPLAGDGEITVRVLSVQNVNPWAKAGVMIRAGTAADSPHAFVCLTPGNGVAFQRRTTAGSSSAHTAGPRAAAPTWVRLRREGNAFTAFTSPDGVAWNQIGTAVTIAMPAEVRIGLAVTSHRDGTLCEARFDHLTILAAPAAAN